jgi:electron transfer flavoprotein alpha subunit
MVASLYGPSDDSKSIWVYLERDGRSLAGVSLELLSQGRRMADHKGWPLVGLLMGHQVRGLAERAFDFGADQVWCADHSLLENFTIEAYTRLGFQAILEARPSVLLLGATPDGRDLAGRLAVRLRTGLNADCTDLRMGADSDVLVCEVSGFGGGVLAMIEMQAHRPQMATVRPGVFEVEEVGCVGQREIIPLDVDITVDDIQTRLIERSVGGRVDLTGAPVIIAGGRGMAGDFSPLNELAELLGGEVGATRPPVDEGHIQRERQIGQTGVVCSPKIAICCGISGAFHFVVGIEKADVVVAINSDPAAPIFDHADYCIVGDVHQILPALIRALRAEKEAAYV